MRRTSGGPARGACATVFAWLTGNGDLHAKNVSVLQQAGEWRIAPIYDAPPTVPYATPPRPYP